MKRSNSFLHQLVETLQLLAANYQTQVSVLPKYTIVTDEIALIYHECILQMSNAVASGTIDESIVRRLEEIDKRFEELNKEANFWETMSLKDHPEWNRVRNEAKEILELLGVAQDTPNLNWITYVDNEDSEDVHL